MLTVWGAKQSRCCDGLSRRNFLRAGALGLSGLTLGNLLRLQANQPAAGRMARKSVIMVYLPGGPPHQDTYDLKPDAPETVRGEFKPIRTAVPGMDICELLPLQAKIASQFAIVRGMKFANPDHRVEEVVTGFVPAAARPAFGSVVSRVRGTNGVPPYVSFGNLDLGSIVNPESPQYLGGAHRPFSPGGPGLQNLTRHGGVSLEKLEDRRKLLAAFDQFDRTLDRGDTMASMDAFNRRAVDILRSGRVKEAFDISREPDRVRQKYGPNTQMLLARRLVEAGVSVVTLGFTRPPGWDTHQKNFATMRKMLPEFDAALSTLLTDLRNRGLESDVAVVVWGEFGRSPVISSDGGRDHWPAAGCALLAGGGLRTGQVVGATDSQAGNPRGQGYSVQNVLATLYHVLGIDPATIFNDLNGRPQTLLDELEPIKALL
ncbi:hypothetical protein AYO40_05515 [Planctomycetaceae bacterium SCGC AG-212-D15]|nr:hypothetical protein AYO40_05515 [Planctomycetaceae bacterium SCGC AG-212-D15]